MWFKPKAESVQSDFKPEEVWSTLQSQRGLAQQHRYLLELESKLNGAKTAATMSLLGLSAIVVVLAIATAWNTYQIQQWQRPIETAPHPDQ